MGRVRARAAPAVAIAQESDEELARLAQSLPHGDQRRDRACEVLVRRHEHIVRSCVARYRDTPEAADELMQVGYLGLTKAIMNFDPAVGGSLAAYAQPTVSGELKRYFRDKRWQVRPGRPVQELRLAIRAAAAELTQQLGRTPRDSDLAAHLNISEAEVAEAQLAARAFQAYSIDAPTPGEADDARTLADVLGADDGQLDQLVDMHAVRQHWAELPRREQQLLLMRFYGNMTQEQIGAKLGISQMHVSRLLNRALAYLREQLTGTRRAASGPR